MEHHVKDAYLSLIKTSQQLAAVTKSGHAIQHIKDPSEEVQLVAVRLYGSVIDFINDPSEKVRLAAGLKL